MQASGALSLLGYSSIDFYGTGEFSANGSLALHAAAIRGFNTGSGVVTVTADRITLDNAPGRTATGATAPLDGTLAFNADTITLGTNRLAIGNFANVALNASEGVRVKDTGNFATPGTLEIITPVITAAAAANQSIEAAGALTMRTPIDAEEAKFASGLGGTLALTGASVVANTNILLPSGSLTLRATNGDVTIGNRAPTRIDVGGTAKQFYDLVRYTGGGQITLMADAGSVTLSESGTLAVDARPEGGDAGAISIKAADGDFTLAGEIMGQSGSDGRQGSFAIDVATVPGGALSDLNATLNTGGFTESRSFRIRTGDVLVDGIATARHFDLSTDAGSITVTGTINASGRTGGTIDLRAFESVVLDSGALLTVAGDRFSNAGKGGAVSLDAGSQVGGIVSTTALLDLRSGSTIDLGVTERNATSEQFGRFSGTLHLRAPQNAAGTDLQLAAIGGQMLGASSIVVEGYRLYTPAGGDISSSVQSDVRANGDSFVGVNGTAAAGYDAMHDRLLANNAGLDAMLAIVPGAELINLSGDLTLGSEFAAPANDWNLAEFRFGPKSAAGVLTLRAAGDLAFYNALNDGFTSSSFTAPLTAYNPLLPANAQSWSYRLTAGADLTAADFTRVQTLDAVGSGSLLLGKNAGLLQGNNPGNKATTISLINPSPSLSYFQTIRTGSGDITISTGRDVRLLNQFATIYTAGTRVADANTLVTAGDFVLPIVAPLRPPNQGELGTVQQNYAAQYSMAGGSVNISAGADITHLTRNTSGMLIADSTRQLPNNWLDRRGYVDPLTGEFGAVGVGSGFGSVNNPDASTTWWIDFSNFFQGVGALGGGDVTMTAGQDIANVDAVIPTNARMPKGRPDTSKLLELGGGDLVVSAGRDISGGVYYVERGHGDLAAGNTIHTNQTRTPSLGILAFNPEVLPTTTWLPTTLFAGRSTFDVSANGDVLLGPVANTFLLPQGLQNKFWNRTYFTTYDPDAAVNVFSLGGNVTLQTAATLPDQNSAEPLLEIWLRNQLLLGANSPSAYHPWLLLSEASVTQFTGVSSLMPSTLRATALSGDVNLAGNLTLFPSPTGTIALAAAGSINGLQPNGISTRLIPGQNTVSWSSSRINLSDADPAGTPRLADPLAFSYVGGQSVTAANATNDFIFDLIDLQFRESGSSFGNFGALQTKQALHAQGPLHANDADPVRLYATGGNIAGLTLFSGKSARVLADRDITDIGLYIQNVSNDAVSVVAAGRDIVAYNASSPLRVSARNAGNSPTQGEIPLTGDIQISGPGTLEVLTGRDFDLGVGPNNPDGTGLGVVSIGNARNPFLPFDGASIVAGAGIGFANGLSGSKVDFDRFIEKVDATTVSEVLSELNAERIAGAPPLQLDQLTAEQRGLLALEVFFRVLRDSGRDSNTTQNYDTGFAAIDDLFGNLTEHGDILLTSREIKTANGGRISLFAPTGGLVVGFDVAGNQALDQGVLTERGGAISIFTDQSVIVGTSRIFTLRGGDIVIWASEGDIAAGASSKTVQSAPPTRVLIDPQTADVKTDLSGLATGGGIGVLATVKNVPPGNVDLIAPGGTVDAGDAGVRASGNINVAAAQVANATNFSSGGSSSGVPAASSGGSAPSLGGLAATSSASSAASSAANDATRGQDRPQSQATQELPSIVTVEVLGYGGGPGFPDDGSSDDEDERKKKAEEAARRNSGASAITPTEAGA
ncbi:MAG: filamentous hemagglutinin family protein [Chthoniobacteraceae bacterium]